MNDLHRLLITAESDEVVNNVRARLEQVSEGSLTIDRVVSLSDAIAATHDQPYDLVIVDLELPDCSGLANVTRLKEAAPSAAVIVLTAGDDDALELEAIRHGAQEVIAKCDVGASQLVRVVSQALARQQYIATAQSQAMTDTLTGIGNRRAFEREMDRRLHEFRRHGVPFSLGVFDIDNFKKINDDWGHDVGDKTLRVVGESLYQEVRATDMAARLGGEVFAVIFVSTHLADALPVSHRVRAKIGEMCAARIQDELQLTLSGGVVEVKAGDDLRSMLHRADEALYAAKHSGCDCCYTNDGACVSPEPPLSVTTL
ncbi:diguanylate cyclase [Blastopirellula retiformator]|uniref:diguanylate cyclase n=1 Tax=Blastopirellula retiformator TaxID=2527970 RepID=A0A5C5UTY5_9BACT|nr:diguanylate cyclase [Blastopirellula retiformator]TWT29528.1 Response regulator PleD [Blastopirellula retiformator]